MHPAHARTLPAEDPTRFVREVETYALTEILPRLRASAPEAAIHFEEVLAYPGMAPPPESDFTRLMRELTGTDRPAKVSFGTEGGCFAARGIPSLVCGPGDGIRYLDDSNIDWGQDYKLLVRWLRERGITDAKGLYHPYHLAPFVARYYGLALQPPTWAEIREPTPGWYAVSAHLLQRPALAHDPEHGPVRFDWLDRFTPVAKIGYSIYVYRFD